MEVGQGSRASAMSDVAARAGVSLQTVSRVVNGSPHVAPLTRQRVEQAIAELGYRPNTAARALVTGATRTIGLVTHNLHQYGPAQTMVGLERSARHAGYSLRIAVLDEASGAAMQAAVEDLVAESVDAVVALATYADALDAVDRLTTSVPVVTVQAGPDPRRPTVWVDQEAGARLATRHLLELGHATVHHVAGPVSSLEARRRLAGWRAELRAAGVPAPTPLRGDWTPASGLRAGQRLVERLGDPAARPTAVFVGNDQMAVGMLRALADAGVDVPGEVSVVGFDDVPEAAYLLPGLTTVRQDFAELGRRGVGLVLDRLSGSAGGGGTPVQPQLVVRSSTAAPA
ncbi:LacI family DNA-binding transcriptional regulator [Blastococcus sp. URHD0036]|uniref:LacI family DNA-binding transcriptional regulator n=1 Tax=Blastococcus sp. URHD0036 TaxID=1380356 RepID=UPI000496BA07|nr:LacI family DNA-binding transcriptional regulator [Blastococcus sp. URHD0036]